MKISFRQYAQALYSSLSGKSKLEQNQVLTNFSELLIKERLENKVEEIAEAFEVISDKEAGILRAEIISVRELGPEIKNKLKDYLQKKVKAETIIFTERIDEKLKGGFILKYQDKVLDASLSTKLSNLQKFIN